MPTYDVTVQITLEYGGKFEAETKELAIEEAIGLARLHGELIDYTTLKVREVDGQL
jgi:hypothetical protein